MILFSGVDGAPKFLINSDGALFFPKPKVQPYYWNVEYEYGHAARDNKRAGGNRLPKKKSLQVVRVCRSVSLFGSAIVPSNGSGVLNDTTKRFNFFCRGGHGGHVTSRPGKRVRHFPRPNDTVSITSGRRRARIGNEFRTRWVVTRRN